MHRKEDLQHEKEKIEESDKYNSLPKNKFCDANAIQNLNKTKNAP